MTGLVLALVLALLAPVATLAAEPQTRRISLYICASARALETPWRQTVVRSAGRALSGPDGVRARIMGEAQCGAHAVEFACTGGIYDTGGRVLICSPDTLLSLVRLSAWYALAQSESPADDYEAFRLRQASPLGVAALRASNAPAFRSALDGLRQASESAGAGYPEDGTALLFQSILDMVFAAILGHEASHIEDAPPFCSLAAPSRAEEARLWALLVRVNASGELFAPGQPDVGEVAADRCALRRIRVARAALEAGRLSARDQEFVRRAAADIVSTVLLVRAAPSGELSMTAANDRYLHGPLRIVALAGEMNLGAGGPVLCGGAAENAVQATERTMQTLPGQGLMPDGIEHTFPAGVIDAWNRKDSWSPKSYSCR